MNHCFLSLFIPSTKYYHEISVNLFFYIFVWFDDILCIDIADVWKNFL